VKDPEPLLVAQGIAPRCFLHPERVAVLDAAHRVRIDNDFFYFSSLEAKAAFLRDPLRYVSRVSDPVTHARFKPTRRSPHVDQDGVRFYFADAGSRLAFTADPDSFAGLHNGMLPMPEMSMMPMAPPPAAPQASARPDTGR
jgi:YHS domain-containing protein